jgi:hypothetical protein
VAFGAGQFGAGAGVNAANASDLVDPEWSNIFEMMRRQSNKLNSSHPTRAAAIQQAGKGHVFETLNDFQDNIRRAEQGKGGAWKSTHWEDHRSPQDSKLIVDGNVVSLAQDKFVKVDSQNAKSLAHPKYQRMELRVPKGDGETWKEELRKLAEKARTPDEKARFLDAAKRVREGVSRGRVDQAVNNPGKAHFQDQARALAKEVAVTAASAAVASAVITGATSSIRNGIGVVNGKVTINKAAKAVTKDVIVGGSKAGAQATFAGMIRTVASKLNRPGLAKGAAPAALSAAIFDVGAAVYDLITGKADAEETMTRIGETGCCAVGGLYAGVAASAAFGKVGTVTLAVSGIAMPLSAPVLLASTASYIVVSAVYQSSIGILRAAKLEIKEAERARALAEAAYSELRRQRETFEQLVEEHLTARKVAFEGCFAQLDDSIMGNDIGVAVGALDNLATLVGRSLKFPTFEAFDDFMLNSSEPLRF